MLNKRWAIVAGIVMAVATLLISASLAVAQEGQPPVEPAVVSEDAMILWNQLDAPMAATTSVPSYYDNLNSPSPDMWAVAADNFVVTGSVPVTFTAWIVSQVVLRIQGDVLPIDTQDRERARLCFYGDAGGVPPKFPGDPYPWSSGRCFGSQVPTSYVQENPINLNLFVVTYTLPTPLLFLTGSRHWLSVQMWPTANKAHGATFFWFWRPRQSTTAPYGDDFAEFAFGKSASFTRGQFKSQTCDNIWQVQRML
jgi:hypothetical protein